MTSLLRKPNGTTGKVHDITPKNAGWDYVGFSLYHLKESETAAELTGDTEVILVIVEGKAMVSVEDKNFGELGECMSVFERIAPHCIYIPNASDWSVIATIKCMLPVCSAPGKSGHSAQIIGPKGIALEEHGKGSNIRYIHNIAMENRDVADSLLVTEVFTPLWSLVFLSSPSS